MAATRTEKRAHQFDVPGRVALLEEDADQTDGAIAELRSDTNKLIRILIGLLVSITAASLLLAANLAVGFK